MQKKVLITSLIICVSTIIGLLNSTAFSGNDTEIAKFFKSCIAKEIKKCDSKVILLKSSISKNLQYYTKTKAQKADFFKAKKEMLVQEMIEMQLEPKHYKVELFLNRRFQERDKQRK